MGFIGGVFVIILYLWLLARAAMIARKCTRVLPTLLIIGMASMIAFQALFHIAINVGVFPVSGQPLPLVSMGGTSILVNSIAFGIMLSVSRTIANYNKNNNKVEDSQLPGSLNAENPSQILPKNEWK
jgi:cell division protein FtsW